jgi:hypothetical protein
MPRPPTPKVKKWGEADESILYELLRTDQIDIEDTSLETIERIRLEHFQHRSSENFRRNFRNYITRLGLEDAYHGARQRAAEEGKLRVCFMLFILFNLDMYLPVSTPPLPPPPQEWKSHKTPLTTTRRSSTKRRTVKKAQRT